MEVLIYSDSNLFTYKIEVHGVPVSMTCHGLSPFEKENFPPNHPPFPQPQAQRRIYVGINKATNKPHSPIIQTPPDASSNQSTATAHSFLFLNPTSRLDINTFNSTITEDNTISFVIHHETYHFDSDRLGNERRKTGNVISYLQNHVFVRRDPPSLFLCHFHDTPISHIMRRPPPITLYSTALIPDIVPIARVIDILIPHLLGLDMIRMPELAFHLLIIHMPLHTVPIGAASKFESHSLFRLLFMQC